MDQNLQTVLELIQADVNLSEAEKIVIIARLNDADKKMTLDAFRIERGDQLKKTMSVLLDETIEELEHKRKAVEEKNRDLEIEASLERVRSMAMGMRTPDDLLNICKILFEELTALGFGELRNAMINIVNDENGSFLNYDFNGGNGASVTPFLYNSHPVMERQVEMTRSAGDAFFEHVLTGDDLEDFKAFRVRNGEPRDPQLEDVSTLYYYFYSIGIGSLGISTFSSLTYEKLEVLKRFRNVFDLAYRRYADIQLAEAQAREAQIELALERVRARTMAMQKSDELPETSSLLFQQVKELGEAAIQNSIAIVNEVAGFVELSTTLHGSHVLHTINVPINDPYLMAKAVAAWKAKRTSLTLEFKGQELKDYNELRNSFLETKVNFPEDLWVVYISFFSKGWLSFSFNKNVSDNIIVAQKRFAAVFDQTYTRFLDLQKAEAQTRESQIELALERVRARTMAMQHSEELAETAFILFQQFKELGENPDQATIGIINEDEQVIEYWVTMYGSQINKVFKFPIDEPNVTHKIYKSWKAKKTSLVIDISGKELHDFAKFRESMGGAAFNPDEKRRVINVAFFSKGLINVQSSEERSGESIRLLERFAGVFDGTYTRFLDLKKAEAQAREAQIELALERVRARTMAMQKSDELKEIIKVVYEQLVHLNMLAEHAGFIMDYRANDDMQIWLADKHFDPSYVTVLYFDTPHWNSFNEAKKKGKDFFANHFTFEEKNKFYEDLFKLVPGATDEAKEYYFSCPGLAISTVLLDNVGLYIENFSGIPYTDDENNTLMRFGKVFQQTYTRFLDLQKAEAQAREAQVELSLERVRAKTMAMHTSEHVGETVATMFDELVKLGVEKTVRCGISVIDESQEMEVWRASYDPDGKVDMVIGRIDMTIHPLLKGVYKAWKNKEAAYAYDLAGEDIKDYYQAINNSPKYPAQFEIGSLESKQFHNAFFFPEGAIFVFSLEQLSEDAVRLFKRFAGVFGLTYRRYLDLQKAEEQARESQIQLALERVRARTMAMQKSEELQEVIQLVYEQLNQLNFNIDVANFALNYKETDDLDLWLSVAGRQYATQIHVPYFDHPMFTRFNKAKEQGGLFTDTFSLEEKNIFFQHFFKHTPETSGERKAFVFNQPGFARSVAFMNNTVLTISNYEGNPYSEAENNILLRFGKVFDQTYTRFNDLKQAEEQTKESQIQLALERVRARTMAMQKSEELAETATVLFQQLLNLGISSERTFIGMPNDDTRKIELWGTEQGGSQMSTRFEYEAYATYAFREIYKAWQDKRSELTVILKGKHLEEHVNYVRNVLHMPLSVALVQKQRILYNAFFSKGLLMIVTPDIQSKETLDILERFAGVFDGTYTRFLDLQKAEEQAREATIEASLERVRGKAMAMRNTNDLSVTASTIFTELRNLGINPIRSGVGLVTKETRKAKIYSNTSSSTAANLSLMGEVTLAGHPAFEHQYRSWFKQENYVVALKGADLASYNKILSAGLNADLNTGKDQTEQYGHWFMFSEGFLYAWSVKRYTGAEMKILERFKNVIELTFRRYIELQKSEASARDAVREASLDRVRAEIASMRSTEDLERITPLIWNELTILGIPFIRCGVFIIDEEAQVIHTHLSTADGKALATFNLQFDSEGIGRNVLPAWREKQIATIHWSREEFADYTKNLVEQGTVKSKERYVTEHPDTSLDLHFFPFLQGMLYAGNTAPLTDDEKDLVQSLADAFSTAYARYEDFNKLEAAKEQVENTLTDLKAAQTKLIQSEKMASLGELTAGIAHEIQNPLNFVNNFSEVNQEMIDELQEELMAGNIEEALALAADIKQNEEKINHHGKRADGIVKGMLQHSRTGGGEKQPTNMNTLADEFLRLSYHGLRAKDKLFNSEMVTHFDPDLPKINVIPQDMGRVLLNLFNNAFYAVNQKQKTGSADYKPEVSVTTSTENGQLIIKVKDNGVGMPDAIKAKIMQPFFTTKPTGEGTGLGLSLTYDMVVKGHGGSIMVESVEGEGSEFIVKLPLN